MVQRHRGVTGKPVRLADPPSLLAGREELLAELDNRLAGGDGSGPRTVALWGLGGAGKTSVAVAYAHRHLAEVGLAWQFAAENPTVLAAGFGELAAQLGARDVVDTRDPVASVHGVLAAYPSKWMLVFDNVPDLSAVEGYVPPAGRGRVLITSQNQHWPHGQPLEVPFLSTEVAADFLVTRTGDQDRQAARELADEMGGLPLALEQAGAYIRATGESLAVYLGLFRQRRADMLARGEPTGYDKTVATTWSLAFERLEQADPGATGLLRLLASCAPEAVPLRLLLRPRPGLAEQVGHEVAPVLEPLLEDELAAGEAIAGLRSYSLITLAADWLVTVHKLVQAVTTDQLPADLAEAWRQAAAVLIELAIPADTARRDTWPMCAALLPHVQATLPAESVGMGRIAVYLGSSGSYAAARDLTQRVFREQARVRGAEHPDTLATWNNLAAWTGQAGDAAGARDQFAALLPVRERVSGAERPDTLTVRANMAAWTGQAGNAVAARDLYTALLPVRERVSGAEHPDTFTARANLAYWTGQAGNAAAAREQLAALLPMRERVSGPEHPDTLAVRTNLAWWTGQAGDVAGARDQCARLLPIRERVSGTEHPHTLGARANLAWWTGQAGDAAGAREQLAALLPVRERVSGPEHPDTLGARANFATVTGQEGNAAEARDQFAALLPVFERVLGAEHPETLAARDNLAWWTGRAGNAAGARDQYATLVPLRERVQGTEHPSTLTTRAKLADWTGQAGNAPGAREQLAALLPVYERVQGSEHPHTLTTRANMADWTGQVGDAAAARDQYAALLPVRGRVSGPEHPDTLTVRANMAAWTGRAGNATAARDQCAALLPIYERAQGPEHPDTRTIRNNLRYWTGVAGSGSERGMD